MKETSPYEKLQERIERLEEELLMAKKEEENTEITEITENENSFLSKLKDSGYFNLLLAAVPTLIILFQTYILYSQNKVLVQQNMKFATQNELLEHQNNRLDEQSTLQEAERRSASVALLGDVMDAMDRELVKGQRDLSPQLSGRIIALSHQFKPYQYMDGDTLISQPLSPERGQLLINLLESNLSQTAYQKIFGKGNFSYADLRGMKLDDDLFLKGINLKSANLEGVNFTNANLEEAQLENANLKGAVLRKANLKKAMLGKVKMTTNWLNLPKGMENDSVVGSYDLLKNYKISSDSLDSGIEFQVLSIL